MITRAELLLDARNAIGESPVWSVREQALYWVDIIGKRVHRFDPASGRTASWATPQMVGCIALRADGTMVAGLERGIYALELNDDGTALATELAEVPHASPGMRCNDGRCDRQGRFWVGTMFNDTGAAKPVGALYRYDARGLSSPFVERAITSNGLAFSPDGRTMYCSDSHPSVQTVWAFDFDIAEGVPSNRRVFIDMRSYPGRPDGATVDADGCYWICGIDSGYVHRFTPRGQHDLSLALPVEKPSMCAFGGPRLDTLYVTSIRPPGIDLAAQPLAGGVFVLRPGIQGLPEADFTG